MEKKNNYSRMIDYVLYPIDKCYGTISNIILQSSGELCKKNRLAPPQFMVNISFSSFIPYLHIIYEDKPSGDLF